MPPVSIGGIYCLEGLQHFGRKGAKVPDQGETGSAALGAVLSDTAACQTFFKVDILRNRGPVLPGVNRVGALGAQDVQHGWIGDTGSKGIEASVKADVQLIER